MGSTVRELIFRVSVAGQSDFARDLRGLTDFQRRVAEDEVRLAKMVAARKRGARTEEQKHAESVLKTQLALEKARAKESVRAAEQASREKQRADDRAAKGSERAALKAAKERDRIARDELRNSVRRQAEELRAFERNEKEKTRVALREAKSRAREEASAQRFAQRAEANTSRFQMQQRMRSIRQFDREEQLRERDRMFDFKRFYRGIGSGIGDGVNAAYGLAMKGGRSILSGVGAQHAWDVDDIVAERMQGSAMMRSVAIEARTAGSRFDFDEKGALGRVGAAARWSGLSQKDLFQAIDVYSEKGSGATAVQNIGRITSQAVAMGTNASVVAKLRAQMGLSSKVAGKELSEDEKDDLIAKMHFVGKTGVFRAEDMAAESESLFSQFAKSGMDFRSGFTRYLSFANEARKATGSGAMARTAINSVQDAIAKKEDKLNKLGVKTRDGDGEQRDFIDVVMDTIVKTGAKGKAFNTIFDPSRSGKAISTMVSAFQGAGGGAAGRAAMVKLLEGDESIKKANVSQMNADAAARLSEPSSKIKQSVETIRQALAEKLSPALELLAKNAPMIAETIAKTLDLITKHPALAAVGFVAASGVGGGIKNFAGSALRLAGDSLGNKLPGFGAAAKGVGGLLQQSGATPVFITGAAPGVMGGGGPGGTPGGDGGGMGGAVMGGAAIAGVVGYGIASVINDTNEQEAKLKGEAAEWRKAHPNAGGGMKSDPDYLAKRYGPGAKNPDAEDPAYALARAAMNSPYDDPQDYLDKYLDPGFANSPMVNADDYYNKVGGSPGKGVGWGVLKRVDQPPAAPAPEGPTSMPATAGQPGYGVLKPVAGEAPVEALTKAAMDFSKTLDEVNRKLAALGNGVSRLKPPPPGG